MAIESDVLVIGGGLAGMMSALAAAEEGASVRLISYKQSTLRQASGLIDLLGYLPGEQRPVVSPYEAIGALPAEHPYAILGVDRVRAAMDRFDTTVGYDGGGAERNTLVATHAGGYKPTFRTPQSVTPGALADGGAMLLVGFDPITDFDAPFAAAMLTEAGVPFEVHGETLPFPIEQASDAGIGRFAALIEEDPAVPATGRTLRESIATAIGAVLGEAERVGVPAILGTQESASIIAELEAALGVPVFEVPMGPPSLLGSRLEAELHAALDRAGVSMELGNPVVDADADARISTVYVEKNHAQIPYAASEYVLATGGLVGKGVGSDRSQVHEPVFGCHIPHPADRSDWYDDDVFGAHPFARFGVRVGGDLRPQTADGAIEYQNLRAAGSVIGGADFAKEKSGSGISIATGVAAGTAAAEEAA
jgi:glycerol 3-phosphate dehydrogenase (quinone) subunit B (EC 1.1.5.3)